MPTEVHVIYTGIVSFVPLASGEVRVAIPNAKKHGHHPHQPHVVVPRHARVSGLKELESLGDLTAYGLDDHHIDFGVFPEGRVALDRELVLPLAKGSHAKAPNCGNPRSTYHGQHHNKVAAWSRLLQGRLAASYVHPLHVWAFRHPDDSRTPVGHLAQEVCHSFEIPGATLAVSFRARDAAEVGRIELDAKGGRIEMRIGNTMAEDVFPGASSRPDKEDDQHVKLYYELSEPPVAEADRSYLVRLDDSDDPREVDDHGHSLGGNAWLRMLRDARKRAGGGAGTMAVGGLNCPPALWETQGV